MGQKRGARRSITQEQNQSQSQSQQPSREGHPHEDKPPPPPDWGRSSKGGTASTSSNVPKNGMKKKVAGSRSREHDCLSDETCV